MKIALVGNQNSGKTTLFNLLTGLNQKIGNWPGVTIEKKEGKIKGTDYELVDLPGVYSLSPYTLEEEVSRKFIYEEKPDLIINIIDATSLERSLYLTTQLLELNTNVIVLLNMCDMLERKHIKIDVERLSEMLKVKVYKISAFKNEGLEEVISDLKDNLNKKREIVKIYPLDVESSISKIEKSINLDHPRFSSVNILQQDILIKKYESSSLINNERLDLENIYEMDLEQLFASLRYDFIETVRDNVYIKDHSIESFTDKLDKVILNKYAAIPIFVIIMFLVYYLSVGVIGSFTVEAVSSLFDDILIPSFNNFLVSINTSEWLISLLCDGILSGIGAVLNFIPQLIILFLCIALLETSGYMSRIAFFLDRLFVKFGLSGKSLIPFIVGSGCSVPGIMSSRTIENQDERTMSVILTPFIPCSAKLPIIALFAGAFFDQYSGLVSASLYFFAIIVIVLSALLMKKFIFVEKNNTFISELPEYKLPKPKYILRDVFEKVLEFFKRAGSIILLCSVIVWFLSSFNFKLEYGIDIEDSMLASIGKCFSWLFYFVCGGHNSWGATVSAVQGLIAKEQVVSSMAIINKLSTVDEIDSALLFAREGVFGFFNPFSAYAFMVFNLFSAPCVAAIGAMRKELGSKKKTLFAVLFQTTLALILASIIGIIGMVVMK